MKRPRQEIRTKVWWRKFATLRRLNLLSVFSLLVVSIQPSQAISETANFPSFRHVDATSVGTAVPINGKITVLADEDFAPWSFKAADGTLQGISVELAAAACTEAALTCTIVATPFADLLPTLRRGEAQLVISGIRPDVAVLNEFRASKPYFRSLGRFVVRQGSSLSTPDIRTLAGKRLGFIGNTSHARFLEKYYSRSNLMPFASSSELQDALRTGQIDVVFGDSMQMAFWLSGSDARSCCAFLGKAFMHRETFSRSLVFVGGKNQNAIVDALDAALDQLDSKSVTAGIFSRYLPSPIW